MTAAAAPAMESLMIEPENISRTMVPFSVWIPDKIAFLGMDQNGVPNILLAHDPSLSMKGAGGSCGS
jgi:hypothetical protein